jgi:hypothetical protein
VEERETQSDHLEDSKVQEREDLSPERKEGREDLTTTGMTEEMTGNKIIGIVSTTTINTVEVQTTTKMEVMITPIEENLGEEEANQTDATTAIKDVDGNKLQASP